MCGTEPPEGPSSGCRDGGGAFACRPGLGRHLPCEPENGFCKPGVTGPVSPAGRGNAQRGDAWTAGAGDGAAARPASWRQWNWASSVEPLSAVVEESGAMAVLTWSK
ncbi:hypothetical protein Acsp03_06130 [Actinomadura sp. NBRC 104412]|nr:hypothetical protein Acsp03_06130 [Actinomadura sp. NBRC 104412]